jgi:putative acetyltransferase
VAAAGGDLGNIYQKFGFQIEGTLQRYAYRDGEYVDSYTMAWVRE